MSRRYVAEFKVVGQAPEQSKDARPSSEVIEKERTFDSKVVGKALTYGAMAVAMGSRIYAGYSATRNAIVGDSIAQRQLDNRMAYLNEGLTIFGSLGIAALVNPAALGAAATALTVQYTLRGIQTAQANEVKQAQFAVERATNEQRQARLVRDITGIRI